MATRPRTNEDTAKETEVVTGDVSYADKDEALAVAKRVAAEDAELLRRLAK